MDRRAFLKAAGGAAIGLPAAIACGTAGGPPLGRAGLQLYTVRDLVGRDMERTLELVAGIGYREVEFAGYFDHAPEHVRSMLDHLHIDGVSAHFPLEAFRTGLAATLEAAQVIGHRYLVLPWWDEEARGSMGAVRAFAAELNRIGAACRDAGVRFAYHNHDFEFGTLDGRVLYDVLLEQCDPALVEMELDLFWIVNGGGDPLAYFHDYPGRFPLWHVKDRTSSGQMVDVGAGSIDFKAMFAQAGRAGLRHYFVEHDQPADPVASIRKSYLYLAQLDG